MFSSAKILFFLIEQNNKFFLNGKCCLILKLAILWRNARYVLSATRGHSIKTVENLYLIMLWSSVGSWGCCHHCQTTIIVSQICLTQVRLKRLWTRRRNKVFLLLCWVTFTSPIHTGVWMRLYWANSPPLSQCESLGGSKGWNLAPALIRHWRYYQGHLIGEPNQCEWISRLRISRAYQSYSLITAQVPHTT